MSQSDDKWGKIFDIVAPIVLLVVLGMFARELYLLDELNKLIAESVAEMQEEQAELAELRKEMERIQETRPLLKEREDEHMD